MTKDADFVELLEKNGPPPGVADHLWKHIELALAAPRSGGVAGNPDNACGEALVELGDQFDRVP